MNLKFKIAANTFVQILGRFITAGATLLVTILVARQFGAEGYGEFTKIMTYVALFYLISDFGFNAIVLKKMTEKQKDAGSFFRNLLGMRLVGGLLLIFFALVFLNLLPYNSLLNKGFSSFAKLGIIVASLTILTQAIFTTTNVLFQKNLRYDLSVLSSSVGSAVILVLVVIFTLLRASLLTVVTSYVLGGIVMGLLSLKFARRFLSQIYLAFDFSLWKKIFWQTLPLGATLIFNLIYFRADMFLLALLRPNVEVGIYGLSYKFFEFPLAFITFFMNSIYPVMLTYHHQKREKLKNLVKNLAVFLLFSSLVLMFLSWFLAPAITLIKEEFTPAILALRILAFSFPFFFLSALFMWTLITLGKQKLLAFFYGASMLLNILLNLIFIPRYGYLAAAVTTGVTELAVLVLTGVTTFSVLTKPQNLPKIEGKT